jgi:hypothetical protein
MPAYYFAMGGYHTEGKPDPAVDKLITIQYQKIDLTSAEPLEKLTILKEWESSEESIVTTLYNQFFRHEIPVTHFIPVGMNLDYAYEMIIAKCRKYHLPITSHQLYYQRPRFDLGPVIVLLNDGRFAGASLDSFSSKKSDAGRINKWYTNKDFKKIEHTLQDDAETFLKLLQYLSKYKTRLGIARKGEPAHRKPAQTPPPTRTEKALSPHPKSPATSRETTKKQADTGIPAPRKSPAQLLKAPPPYRGKAPSKPASAGLHSSVPLNQFRKHTPTKKHTGKRE